MIIYFEGYTFTKSTKNKTIFGRVIATIYRKLCLYWKNKKKTLNLSIIMSNKFKSYKVNYENIK